MAIKSYQTLAAYNAATKSTIESQVSLIETSRDVIVDGVNIVTTEPTVGDAIYLDESNNIVYLKGGDWLKKAIIPSAWTHVGYVFARKGRQVAIVDKDATDMKYCDVCQYAITAISSTSISITVYNSSGTAKTVSVTLTSAAINSTSASEITAALEAASIDSNAWWAYLNDDGTAIIVQCDTWAHYTQYQCSMSGGTIALWSWKDANGNDMPASDVYFKNDGGYTNYWGVMNVARTRTWATSNGRVPSTMEPIKVTGNTAPVKPSCFENSSDSAYQYTALIRAEYGTYDNYLRKGYGVKNPQKYGTFALDTDAILAYATLTAPTKAGSTKYRFPAMAYCATKYYNNDALAAGKLFLPTSALGCELLDDDTLAIVAESISALGTTAINNSTYRWMLERYNANIARVFHGYDGYLNIGNVYNGYRVQAVALLDI